MTIYSRISGTGSFLPPRRLTNADLVTELASQGVESSDDWIVERTGIRARHFVDAGIGSSDLGAEAARRAMQAASCQPSDIDLIIVATSTPDMVFPSTAALLQSKLGIAGCPVFDVQAVCSGFIYAMTVADAMIKTGTAKRALVIGAEVFSRILDFKDRTTCVLFGDGAGAVVLSGEVGIRGALATKLHADGQHNELLYVDGGPSTTGTVGKLRMKGREVFRHAVTNLTSVLHEVLASTDLTAEDIDWVVPHQANARIIEATAKKLALDPSKVVMTVDQHANTSAASVPLALDVAVRDGRIKQGDIIVIEAMGGGFTWGASIVRM